MKFARKFLVILPLAALVVAFFLPAGSVKAAEGLPPTEPAAVAPGNYCLGCHTAEDPLLDRAQEWRGGYAAASTSSCPAVRKIEEERYYTDRLLQAIDRSTLSLPAWVDHSAIDQRTAAAIQSYSRLLDQPVTSLEAYTAEAQALRFRLGKSYTQINTLAEQAKRQMILAVGVALTLFILVTLAWGLRNTQPAIQASGGRGSRPLLTPWRVIALALVFVLFALPIFSIPSAPVETASAEELERQATIDEAARAATASDRAQGRAWMLSQIGALWLDSQPEKSAEAQEAAALASDEAARDAAALWGEAQAALEAGTASAAEMDKARLSAHKLAAVQHRSWHLRQMAATWLPLDAEQGQALLEKARREAEAAQPAYRDFDLRALAVVWADKSVDEAVALLNQVSDPALQSWGLREIAGRHGRADLYAQAAKAASRVQDPVERARQLMAIAQAADDAGLYVEALAALEDVQGAAQAYTLAALAPATGDMGLTAEINPKLPGAQALALLRMERYEEAWKAAEAIVDPYEKARAQEAIATAWQNAEAAGKIEVPVLKERALLSISLLTQDESLTGQLTLPYYKVQALTGFGKYAEATTVALNENLKDTAPLVDLAVKLANEPDGGPEAALELVELMSRETEKAEALRAVAIATKDQTVFERALGMALAARVRGDALAPVEAFLALAEAAAGQPEWVQAALDQAYEAALSISTQ